jgi:RNA polymerase sigma-70 factor (sigma-E family)
VGEILLADEPDPAVPAVRARRLGEVQPPDDREAATTALFEAYYVRLVGIARRVLADPEGAEDVAMDAFVGLYRRWDRVRRPEDAYFYLRASVVNGSRNRIRRIVMARSKAPLLGGESPSHEDSVVGLLDQQTMIRALRQLSTRQRQVLVLRYYEELSEAEIAATIGCSVGSVKTHAARGLKALAGQLGGS